MNKKTKLITIGWIAILMLVAAGCANNPNNPVRQQNVQDNNRGPQMLRDQNNVNNRIDGRVGVERVDDQFEIADKAAEKITKLRGVRQANVLVTRRNAYVSAVLDNDQQQLTREIEDKIADQVRAVDPGIRNVYVSTNPEFADRTNNYVKDVQAGRPVVGFFEQFNEIVARIFPNAR